MRLVSDLTLSQRRVSIAKNFEEVVANWQAGTRVSPIFWVEDTPALPDFERKDVGVFFAGPINPAEIQVNGLGSIALTYGAYNLVIFATTKKERTSAENLLKQAHIPWEFWDVKRGLISEKPTFSERPTKLDAVKARKLPHPISLKQPACQYALQIANYRDRVAKYFPKEAEVLGRFDTSFRLILARTDLQNGFKHDRLVNANAALLIGSSQALSGTSPIFETEARMLTHSLLGIGIASKALASIRDSIEQRAISSLIIQRIEKLKEVPPNAQPLQAMRQEHEFWKSDTLALSKDDYGKLQLKMAKQTVSPLLTFFSSRDGFRTTNNTLSAPLETLTSCNTVAWSLQTLTHEISHTFVAAILGALIEHPENGRPDTYEHLIKIHIRDRSLTERVDNLFEQIQSLVVCAIWILAVPKNSDEKLTPSKLREYSTIFWGELNEVLTACFDFMYFFQSDSNRYIELVWTSWDEIPYIEHRVPDYLIRTLSAIHTKNVFKDNGKDLTIDQYKQDLELIAKKYGKLKYASIALELLKKNRTEIRESLEKRQLLVRLMRGVMWSPEVSKELMPSNVAVPKKVVRSPLEFPKDPITNPLYYLKETAADKSSSAAKSLGILQHVAFLEASE